MRNNKKIAVIGAAVIDLIVEIPILPKTGEDVYGKHNETIVGGCAYNVQQVIKHYNLENTLFVPIGKGPYSDIIRKKFEQEKIPIVLESDAQDNGWNISFVENDGERTFLTVPGIETHWKEEWFNNIELNNYDYIYISGYELEDPSGQIIIEQIKKNKNKSAKIVFDPGPRISFIDDYLVEDILRMGTIIHCNESELMTLCKKDTISLKSIQEGAKKIHEKTKEAVIVTMGEKGCYYIDKNTSGAIPSNKVEVVNTIGAGDSHTGAFISSIAKGYDLKKSCEIANNISSKVVQQLGGALNLK